MRILRAVRLVDPSAAPVTTGKTLSCICIFTKARTNCRQRGLELPARNVTLQLNIEKTFSITYRSARVHKRSTTNMARLSSCASSREAVRSLKAMRGIGVIS